MTKKIIVPDKHKLHAFRLDRSLSDEEKQVIILVNKAISNAYRDGYLTGYRERGILTRLKRRLTRK